MFICATDEPGTPAELAALEEGKSVQDYCGAAERGGAEALLFVYGVTLGSQISSGWPSETGSPVQALTREEVSLRSSC